MVINKHSRGFTLVELLIVIALVSIMAAFAVPSYMDSARKGRRSDGQSMLMDAASKMETYYFDNRTYTTTLSEIGYSTNTSPEGHYTLSISAATSACPITSCFELKATAVGGQVDDGDLTINSIGQKLPADKW